MNMIDATMDVDGLRLAGSGQRLALAARADAPREVILGLRPEDLHLADAQEELAIEATVDFAEPTGPALIVFARDGGNPLVASLPPHLHIAPDSRVRFSFSRKNMHLFDKASGRRIET